MDHLKSSSPAATAARAIPVLALPPHDLVTDYMLRKYAQVDPMHVADGGDKEFLAARAMILPDICGELLARRHAMAKSQG